MRRKVSNYARHPYRFMKRPVIFFTLLGWSVFCDSSMLAHLSLKSVLQLDPRSCRSTSFFLKCKLGCCSKSWNRWAGRRGLMDSTLSSGDRVCGFISRSWRSGFFLGFFLLPSSSFPTMWLLSLTMPVGLWIQVLRLCTGEAKRELTWKNPSNAICGGETQK